MAQAIRGLTDHTAELERRVETLMHELEQLRAHEDAQAIADRFDPSPLRKVVDK